MSDRVRVDLHLVECLEGDNFTADIVFEDRASELPMSPGTVHYRVDDVTDPANPVEVQDWAAVTAGESVSIALASAYSAIIDVDNSFEIKQLTVTGDKDATYQCNGRARWTVKNRDIG